MHCHCSGVIWRSHVPDEIIQFVPWNTIITSSCFVAFNECKNLQGVRYWYCLLVSLIKSMFFLNLKNQAEMEEVATKMTKGETQCCNRSMLLLFHIINNDMAQGERRFVLKCCWLCTYLKCLCCQLLQETRLNILIYWFFFIVSRTNCSDFRQLWFTCLWLLCLAQFPEKNGWTSQKLLML